MTAPEFLWGTGFKGLSHSERVSSPIWSTCLFVRFKVRRLPHLNFLCGSILAPQKTGNPNIAHFLLNTFGLVQISRAIIRAMRIGVSMYSYVQSVKNSGMTIPGFIHEAKRAGAEGVELLEYFYKDIEADREAALKALEETGLPCPIFSVGQNFAKIDPEERRQQLAKIKFGVDEALKFGAGVVRVFAGDVAEGITFDQARAWIVEGLTEGSLYAAEHGVKLALENHGTLAGRGDQVRGLIDDVREKSGTDVLGANPDTGNFLLVNQPSHEAIKQVAEYANMVHFKDFKAAPVDHEGWAYQALNGDRFVGTAIGEGQVELGRCIQELKDAGFNGWLSVEYEGAEDPITAIPRSIANARHYL